MPESALQLTARLLPKNQFPFPTFRIREPGVEDLASFRNLLGFSLEASIQIAHLSTFSLERLLPCRDRRLSIVEGRLPSRVLPFEVRRLRDPLGEVPPLNLQLRAGLLRFHREDFSLGLDLHIFGCAAFLEPPHDHSAGLLHRLQLRSEGVELLLTDPAPLVLLFQFPFPFVELFLAFDEALFLFSASFYPLSVYPRGMQIIVECTPLFHGVSLIRALCLGQVGPGLVGHAVYLAALGAGAVLLASRRFAKLLLP